MPMAINWRKFPYISMIIFAFGVSIIIQIPIIYHAQYVLLIDSIETLVITGLSIAIVITTVYISIVDALCDLWESKPYEKIEIPIAALSLVIILYYVPYFGIFILNNIQQISELTRNYIRTLRVEYVFAIVEIFSATMVTLLGMYVSSKLKSRYAFVPKKERRKRR